MHYDKRKRNEIDNCNICGKKTKLTWDHVPPKSVKIGNGAYVNNLFSECMPTQTKYMRHYQNGIKYRTICQKCNGELLSRYDKAYAEFIKQLDVRLLEMSQDVLFGRNEYPISTIIEFDVQINKIIRSILGHFMAMKEYYDTDTIVDNYLRYYFMDDSVKLGNLNLYTWFYPYCTIVNVRDVVVKGYFDTAEFYTHPHGFVSVMNAFPLAYLLSTETESGCNLDDIGAYSTSNIDEIVSIQLHISSAYYPGSYGISNERMIKIGRKALNWPVDIRDDVDGAVFVLGNEKLMDNSIVGIQR